MRRIPCCGGVCFLGTKWVSCAICLAQPTASLSAASRTQSKPTKNPRRSEGLLWYYRDSNLGHTDFQSVALPTELWYRLSERKHTQQFDFALLLSATFWANDVFQSGSHPTGRPRVLASLLVELYADLVGLMLGLVKN